VLAAAYYNIPWFFEGGTSSLTQTGFKGGGRGPMPQAPHQLNPALACRICLLYR